MRMLWGATGQRFYETGLDRGVLFVGTATGVPWSGLVSVEESPTGGEPRPHYIDGVKYLNLASAEEFEATISAFSAPAEFNQCEGVASIHNGLFATQQTRKPFSFSYRTRIANDVEGSAHGYKIHIVYNAMAAPSGQTHQTISDSAEVEARSWSVTTLPPRLTGLRPTAHFYVDSRYTSSTKMATLEDILYGSASTQSRLPSVVELSGLFA